MINKLKSFFFENKTDKQTIIKNTFWLMLAEGFSKGGMFLITIFIATKLGPEQFGILSFVISFVTMFIVITDFGFTILMVREVSKDQSKLQEYLINLSFLKIILGLITFSLVCIISNFIGKPDFYITFILIYCFYAIINNFGEFIRAFFRPDENMQYEALLKIINGTLTLGIVLSAIFYFGDLKNILYGYLIAGFISFIISLAYVGLKFKIRTLKLNKRILVNSLRSGVFIGFGLFLISIYVSVDQVMLGLYNKMEDLGIYGLAYKISMIYGLITGIIFSNIFPRINKNNYLSNIKNNYLYGLKKILKYNIILFILFEILIYILFNNNYLFPEYKGLYMILSTLLIYYIFEPLGYWGYINITSLKKDKINLLFLFFTAIINIVLNIFLIPKYSYYGAIFTTILSYFIYFLLTYFYLIMEEKKHIERINYNTFDDKLDVYLHKKRYSLASKSIKGEKVLDIGCGYGYGTKEMAMISPDKHFYAIDINDEVIDFAKKNNQLENITFLRMSAIDLKFCDNYFDSIISIENIEHINDDKKYLLEANRVLKNKGILFLTTPNDDRIHHRILVILGKEIIYNTFHIREYKLTELKKLLNSSGFKLLNEKGLYLGFLPRRIKILYKVSQIPLIYKFLVNYTFLKLSDYLVITSIKE